MFVGRGSCVFALVAGLILGTSMSAWPQSNVYEGGRVVRADERNEGIEMGASYEGGYSEEGLSSGEEGEEAAKLPWIPVLSPTMICLDCWMTKTYKIWDFYHQQAAQEYFAHSESCADIVLCPDPHVGSAFKYTLLAPIYAMRPHLLLRNCSACGISNPYGVPDPMPSVAVNTASGPQVLSSGQPVDVPAMMPEAAPEVLPPPPAEAPLPQEPAAPQSMNSPTQSASAPQWSQMSDQQILSYFSLTPDTTPALPALNSPAAPSQQWEYADMAPATPASELIASMAPPAPIAPLASEVKAVPVSTAPVTAAEKASVKKETQEKRFSVTDEEYGRMRDIEKGLLSGSER